MKERATPAAPEAVLQSLGKVLPRGRLARIPRHPEHREIVLAVICSSMRRRYPYSEPELKILLEAQLARFRSKVDHVTCRRYLVDLGFVKRDRAGKRYFLNYPRVQATLSSESKDRAGELLDAALAAARRQPPSDSCRSRAQNVP